MKHNKYLPIYIAIFLIKCFSSNCMISNIGLCVTGALSIAILILAIRWRLRDFFNNLWPTICDNGSLLYLAAPALFLLYFDIITSYQADTNLFIISGVCLCLLINTYSHDNYAKAAKSGIICCAGALWLAIHSRMTIFGLVAILAISLIYIILISESFSHEKDIKYNRLYTVVVLLVSDYFILSSTDGIEWLGIELLSISTSMTGSTLKYFGNCGFLLILAVISLCVTNMIRKYQNRVAMPETIFSYVILGYLVIEKWSYSSCLGYVAILTMLFT